MCHYLASPFIDVSSILTSASILFSSRELTLLISALSLMPYFLALPPLPLAAFPAGTFPTKSYLI